MIAASILGADQFSTDMQAAIAAIDPPEKWLAEAGKAYQGFLADEFRQSGPGWAPVKRGGSPLWDTGTLAGSFQSRPIPNGIEVYTNSVQAALMNFGGTVSPKGHPYLPIPIMANGSERRAGKKPREYQNTFVAKSRNGNLIIFQTMSKASKGKPAVIRPLFALKTSVTITPRPFMVVNEEAIALIEDRVLDYFDTHVMKGRTA